MEIWIIENFNRLVPYVNLKQTGCDVIATPQAAEWFGFLYFSHFIVGLDRVPTSNKGSKVDYNSSSRFILKFIPTFDIGN